MLKLGHINVPAEVCRATGIFLGKCGEMAVLSWCESALGCMQPLEFFLIRIVCFRILRKRPSGRSGVWFAAQTRDFSLLQNTQTGTGAHLVSCYMASGGSSHGGETWNCSPPSSTEGKNECSYTFAPSICFSALRRENA